MKPFLPSDFPGAHVTVGVGALVIEHGKLLMVRRARAPARGLWSVPGGKLDRGERLAEAVRREVREETGLEVTVGELAGFFEILEEGLHYVVLDFLATYEGEAKPTPGDDADRARWVPLDEIKTLDCTPRFAELLTEWGVL